MRCERVVGETETHGEITAEIVVDDSRGRKKPMEYGDPARVGEVERDALLVAVERLEVQAVAVADREGSDVACRIAAVAGALDLHDVRTEVAEQRRRERAGTELTNGQDANAV